MATSKSDYYTPIPPDQNYIVLPFHYDPNRHRWRLICAVSFIIVAAVVYVFWPSDPDVKIVRLRLNKVHIHTLPRIAIDISMFVTVKVKNTDVYSMDYTMVKVGVGYRGKKLGKVRSAGGHVRAKGASYVDAELEFDGVELWSDVVYLLEDLAKGSVPFDTVTEIRGRLGLLLFHFPLLAKVSCEVLVNTINQTIARQNCYAE